MPPNDKPNLFQFVRNAASFGTLSAFVRDLAALSGIDFSKVQLDRVDRAIDTEGKPFLLVKLDDLTLWKVKVSIERA